MNNTKISVEKLFLQQIITHNEFFKKQTEIYL